MTLFDNVKNAAEVSEKHFGLPGWRRQDHGPQLVLQQHEVGGVHGGQVSPRVFFVRVLGSRTISAHLIEQNLG